MAFGWDRINKMTREMKERDIAEGRYYLPGLVATGAEGEEIKALTAEVKRLRGGMVFIHDKAATWGLNTIVRLVDDIANERDLSKWLEGGQG